ncbi:MAG TPA: hypothetical protein VFU21_10600, partial [Kofleriaceae bacterium]|nr:hypothetical protein [Kofleriaceae bacterium]
SQGGVTANPSTGATPFLPPSPLGDGSETVWAIMIGGLVAVAAIGLIGALWLFAGRRRHAATAQASSAAAPAAEPLAETTDQLLSRRSRNRARITMTDDPVLAGMGLDDSPRRRSRAAPEDDPSPAHAVGRRPRRS